MRLFSGSLACVAAALLGFGFGPPQAGNDQSKSKEWPTYGHDSGGRRFSPVAQITPANVNRLEVAWVYHMRPATPPPAAAAGRGRGRGGSGFASSETTPLVVN